MRELSLFALIASASPETLRAHGVTANELVMSNCTVPERDSAPPPVPTCENPPHAYKKCDASASPVTEPSRLGSHAFSEPSVFATAPSRLRADPPSCVNTPPTYTLSPSTASAFTVSFAPGFQLETSVPELSIAANLARPEPPFANAALTSGVPPLSASACPMLSGLGAAQAIELSVFDRPIRLLWVN